MKMKFKHALAGALSLGMTIVGAGSSLATETENQNIQVLPAKAPLTIDGDQADWDLSGGVLVCSDVESLRDKMGTWIHAMYDDNYLYVLSRWMDDSPLSNKGIYPAGHGWLGDCLQLRLVVGDNVNNKKMITWVTAWQDAKGKSIIDLSFPGKNFKNQKNAIDNGAKQGFKVDADKKGYTQELAIPWSQLTPSGFKPAYGKSIRFSVEPNFNIPARITMKGIFTADRTPDRVFTFQSDVSWGKAIFSEQNNITPQKLRLSDAREFEVKMDNGIPHVDWTGLIKKEKREGFAKIDLEMPKDGYVSLNIKDSHGKVVRQLLTANFFTKGKHEVMWDGLTNMSYRMPGEVLPAGDYTWEAIAHEGLGLRLVGWAGTPSDKPFERYGGDHGYPSAVTSYGKRLYLGWSGSEAGKAVVCADLNGKLKWSHKRGGFGGAHHMAATKDMVYIVDGRKDVQVIYRLTANKGEYSAWKGTDSPELKINGFINGMDVHGRKLYVSVDDMVHTYDADTGKLLKKIDVAKSGDLEVSHDGTIYVLAKGSELLTLTETGTKPVVKGLKNAKGLAVDKAGNLFVGVNDPDNQVIVYNTAGKELRRIGKRGGRPLMGAWEQGGMRFINALRIDEKGELWVAEKDKRPKRFSRFNAADGSFSREFFGPTAYGALGGAISAKNPLVMVGSGAEWRIDKETGKATCVGVFHRGAMNTARFGMSPSGREYVAVGDGWIGPKPVVSIYERVSEGVYKLRTKLTHLKTGAKIWSDSNDDQKEQPNEIKEYKIDLKGWFAHWGLPMTKTMIFYGSQYRVAPTGWTTCGAPEYDLSKAKKITLPARAGGGGTMNTRGLGSDDGKLMLYNGKYGKEHAVFTCIDIETGKEAWTYPNNFVGVHGGHKAPPAKTGLIRAAYTVLGGGKLPDPIGDIFIISTDKGEWHVLTGEGYYLSHLFQANPIKHQWPATSEPGAILDNCPPGGGTEDFGGSVTIDKDHNLYLQAGKVSFVNMKVVGLDTVTKLKGGKLTVASTDIAKAKDIRAKLLQANVGTRSYQVAKKTIEFTGNLNNDFKGVSKVVFKKSDSDKTEAMVTYDDTYLYLGFRVRDGSPWVNGAVDPAQMYARGDTVDFQLGALDSKDKSAMLGELRLSIGNCQGKDIAIAYRTDAKAGDGKPKKFFSGLVRDGYEMKNVKVIDDARINVRADKRGKQTIVEAAIPLKSIGLTLKKGLKMRGDLGITVGNNAGNDTVLRSHWNNQKTGLVADEVYELKMEPNNWGRITFQ